MSSQRSWGHLYITALNHPPRCGVKELFVPYQCLETNLKVSKQIAFASNSFKAKKKKGNALFFVFLLTWYFQNGEYAENLSGSGT